MLRTVETTLIPVFVFLILYFREGGVWPHPMVTGFIPGSVFRNHSYNALETRGNTGDQAKLKHEQGKPLNSCTAIPVISRHCVYCFKLPVIHG